MCCWSYRKQSCSTKQVNAILLISIRRYNASKLNKNSFDIDQEKLQSTPQCPDSSEGTLGDVWIWGCLVWYEARLSLGFWEECKVNPSSFMVRYTEGSSVYMLNPRSFTANNVPLNLHTRLISSANPQWYAAFSHDFTLSEVHSSAPPNSGFQGRQGVKYEIYLVWKTKSTPSAL